MTFTALIDALFNSLSLTSVLILAGLGLAVTFGVMRVINMAHGDMMMLGAYAAYVASSEKYLGLNLYWAIPFSFLVVGAFGYLLEVGLIRFLYGRPLDTLLATWGVGLMLQQAVSLSLGPDLKPLDLPEVLRGGWQIADDITFPYYRLFVIGLTCLFVAGVYGWYYWTPSGLKIRAVTQNRPMAAALGVSTRRVDALTFALGTGLAGVAGCVLGHLEGVKTTMGNDYVVYAFLVVILGGMGSLTGTLVAAVFVGAGQSILDKVLATSAPQMISEVHSTIAWVLVLLGVCGFVAVRPQGLFAARERVYD